MSASGTPSAMTAMTRIEGCCSASMDDSYALQQYTSNTPLRPRVQEFCSGKEAAQGLEHEAELYRYCACNMLATQQKPYHMYRATIQKICCCNRRLKSSTDTCKGEAFQAIWSSSMILHAIARCLQCVCIVSMVKQRIWANYVA